MNKKKFLTFGILGLFAIALVSAGLITYYKQVSQDINIKSSIEIENLNPELISGFLQSPVFGELVIVENLAPFDVDVNVRSSVQEGEDWSNDITTSYVNSLVLTKKNTSTWTPISGSEIEINYTVIGNTFEVVGVPTEYVAVYYPNVGGYGDEFYTGQVILVEDVNESLPIGIDVNGYSTLCNYCINGENPNAEYCFGAKIWLVPEDSIIYGYYDKIDWNRANEFYFETDLIHYFKTEDGNTVIPEGVSMEFNPMYEFGNIEGDYTVTTEVIPA